MERTRIVLIDTAPLLREILREIITREPDLALVAEHEAVVDVRQTVEREAADFVVVGRDAASADDVRSMVGAGLGVRALEVYSDGKESVLYEQPFRDSNMAVRDLIHDRIATIGENILVRRFTRYALGEEL